MSCYLQCNDVLPAVLILPIQSKLLVQTTKRAKFKTNNNPQPQPQLISATKNPPITQANTQHTAHIKIEKVAKYNQLLQNTKNLKNTILKINK